MFGIYWRRATTLLFGGLIVAGLALSVVSCGGSSQPAGSAKISAQSRSGSDTSLVKTANISEVSPPVAIQELRETLEQYRPQVEILSPKAEAVLEDNSVAVQLQVADLPLFKDTKLGLGPHLHVLLDNQTYQPVYDTSQPVVFSDLTPGTHTIRAFASRPWHESFKNEGAYAQVTFHILTKTNENNPDPRQPLLTYSRPQGAYGAEPIMLDFYLANAPLHLIAQEKADDQVGDWRIRCTVNGTSFIVDRWQPLYLQGFKPGKNWVQLEFLDQQGKPVANAFNTTTRIVNYEPGGKDTLSKLVRGELKASDARSIVVTGAQPKPAAPPRTSPPPTPTPKASPKSEAAPPSGSKPPEQTKELPVVPIVPLPSNPAPKIAPTVPKQIAPTIPSPGKEKSGGFLDRFRKEAKQSPAPEPTIPATKATETVPQPEKSLAPELGDRPQPKTSPIPAPKITPSPELTAPPKVTPKSIEPTVKATPLPEIAPAPKATKYEAKPTPKPSPSAAIAPKPAVVKTPKPQLTPKTETSPPVKTAPVTIEPVKPAIVPPTKLEPSAQSGKLKGFLDRFRKPEGAPSPTPTPASKPTPALTQPTIKASPTPQKPLKIETAKPNLTPQVEQALPAKTAPGKTEPIKSPSTAIPAVKPESTPQPGKLKGFLDRFRKPEVEPSPAGNKTQLKDYLNRSRPAQQTVPNLTVPSVLPAMEAPVKPTVVKIPPVKPSPAVKQLPTAQPPAAKVPTIPKKAIAPDASKTPESLAKKMFSPPSQTNKNLKIIGPEESPALPSRYLKKPKPDQNPDIAPKTSSAPALGS